jgi:hypothetical protein
VTRSRFGLLLAVLGLAVAAGSFAAAWAVLDDGQPDKPPRAGESGDALGSDPVVTTTPTSTSTTSLPAGPSDLATPAWVAVVASEGDEAAATVVAQAIGGAGFSSGVLHSDDYPSLTDGFWVAYAGPYPDRAAADAAVDALATEGFDGAYARCAGTRQECGLDDDNKGNGNGNGNKGDDD